MAKISDKKKVELLEHAVIFGTVEDVQAVLDQHKAIGFLARALGLAAMCGDLRKVQALVDFGADFGYDDTPAIRSAYGTVYRSKTAEYYSYYHLLPLYKGQNVEVPMLSANVSQFHFGKYDYSNVLVTDEDSRYKVVEYLLSNPSVYFSGEELLYYAILWDCPTVVPLLKERYPSLSEKYTDALTESSHSLIKSELWATLMHTPSDVAVQIIVTFNKQLKNEGKCVLMPEYILQQADAQWLQQFLGNNQLPLNLFSAISKSSMLKCAIENQQPELLDTLLKHGYADNANTFKTALQCAQSCGNVVATALLLEYNNQ